MGDGEQQGGPAPGSGGPPTAGMVLHRVLALSARTFLLNDLGEEQADRRRQAGLPDALAAVQGPPPVWARPGADRALSAPAQRRDDRVERIHQSRVAMRRIRSTLRTFHVLVDPRWSADLRADLSWYGTVLGRSRDLDLLADVIDLRGPAILTEDEQAALADVVDEGRAEAMARISREQAGDRRHRLTDEMLVLWEGPALRPKASKPAETVLPDLLERTWRDVRGAGRTARRSSTEAHLHALRIRLKGLRYGCETVALVAGKPARRTARAAERLQTRLGDLHDASVSADWLEALALDRPDLAGPARTLAEAQRQAAADTRKGWKQDLKEVEQRWRDWRR